MWNSTPPRPPVPGTPSIVAVPIAAARTFYSRCAPRLTTRATPYLLRGGRQPRERCAGLRSQGSMTKVEIAPLTGLRFVAAFAILFGHTIAWCVQCRDNQAFNKVAALIGIYGMPLFFVLSGFVIHYNYAVLFRKRPYANALREFLAARFARLYPLYFFFFVFGVISDAMLNWVPYFPRALVSYIIHSMTQTQSWVYKLTVHQKLLLDNGFGLSWSISCELFFYI